MKSEKRKVKRRGFTLIEAIIVISILGVIALVLVGPLMIAITAWFGAASSNDLASDFRAGLEWVNRDFYASDAITSATPDGMKLEFYTYTYSIPMRLLLRSQESDLTYDPLWRTRRQFDSIGRLKSLIKSRLIDSPHYSATGPPWTVRYRYAYYDANGEPLSQITDPQYQVGMIKVTIEATREAQGWMIKRRLKMETAASVRPRPPVGFIYNKRDHESEL